MPRVLGGDLSAYLSAIFTYQLISADTYQHPADNLTLVFGFEGVGIESFRVQDLRALEFQGFGNRFRAWDFEIFRD